MDPRHSPAGSGDANHNSPYQSPQKAKRTTPRYDLEIPAYQKKQQPLPPPPAPPPQYYHYEDENTTTSEETTTTDLFCPTFASPGDTIQAPNIPFDTIVIGTKLGSGTFGSVYKGSARGVVVAIKVLKATTVNIEDLLQEVGIMSHLRFSNIVTMHGVCFHEDNLYIISEYLACGDLEHWLSDKSKEISYIQKIKLLKDVAMAMNWLHTSDPSVIHRDLKPANVLLTTSRRPGDEEALIKENRWKELEKSLMAKVTDMGLSKVLNTNLQLKADGAGSNLWMAPELLKYEYYTEKVDVYSFALLIWQVLTWTRNPFQDYLDRGDLDLFVDAVYHKKVRPTIPSNLKVHPKLTQLMNRGWAHAAQDRPDFIQIATDLDDCLISTLFKDEEYANFWKQNWGATLIHRERRVQPAREVIPWNVFIQGFYEYLKQYGVNFPENPESDVYYLCLKAIVIDPKLDAVSLERLLLVEKWFGPLCLNVPSPPSPALNDPAVDITDTVSHLNLHLLSSRTLSTPSSPATNKTSARSARLDKASTNGVDKLVSPKSKRSSKEKSTNKAPETSRKVKKDSEATTKNSARDGLGDSDKKETGSKGEFSGLDKIRESAKEKPDKDKERTPLSRRDRSARENEDKSPMKDKQVIIRDDSEVGATVSNKSDKSNVTSISGSSESVKAKSTRPRTYSQIARKEKEDVVKVKNRSNSSVGPPPPATVTRSKSNHVKSKKTNKIAKSPQKMEKALERSLVERTEERTVLGEIKRILEQPWFHGDISKEDADSSLATNKNLEGHKLFTQHGDFLVRLSLSEPVEDHPFTITKVNKKGVIFHQRVFYQDNKYTVYTKAEAVPEVSSDSLIGLIKQLVDLKIVNQPCKRWNYARKYADIFEKKASQDGGYLDNEDMQFLMTQNLPAKTAQK